MSSISGVSSLLVFMAFFFSSCKDPGRLKPMLDYEFMELLHDINPVDLCPECKVIRTARSRHCAICNCCVERYDHHCPWVNNCVGIYNHNSFLMFLASIWIKILYHMGIAVNSMTNLISNGKSAISCLEEECQQLCI